MMCYCMQARTKLMQVQMKSIMELIARSYKYVFLQHYQLCVRNKLSQSHGLLHPIIVNNLWERV